VICADFHITKIHSRASWTVQRQQTEYHRAALHAKPINQSINCRALGTAHYLRRRDQCGEHTLTKRDSVTDGCRATQYLLRSLSGGEGNQSIKFIADNTADIKKRKKHAVIYYIEIHYNTILYNTGVKRRRYTTDKQHDQARKQRLAY